MKKIILFSLLIFPLSCLAQINLDASYTLSAIQMESPFCGAGTVLDFGEEIFFIVPRLDPGQVTLESENLTLSRIRKGKISVFSGVDMSGNLWEMRLSATPSGGIAGTATCVKGEKGRADFCIARYKVTGTVKK